MKGGKYGYGRFPAFLKHFRSLLCTFLMLDDERHTYRSEISSRWTKEAWRWTTRDIPSKDLIKGRVAGSRLPRRVVLKPAFILEQLWT